MAGLKENTAVPYSFVGVDEEQGQVQSGSEPLNVLSMVELYDNVYPPKRAIVDNLLYNGTYLFAGAPKVGKSFFMAQLGYHISEGIPLWNYPVNKGSVLYLALEDDFGRLQKRLSRMFDMQTSKNFYLAIRAKTLKDGLENQLTQFVGTHKEARLIIIDTLQKIREVSGENSVMPATMKLSQS